MTPNPNDDLRTIALDALRWVQSEHPGVVRLAHDFFTGQVDPPRDGDDRPFESAFYEWLTFDAPIEDLGGATAFEAFTRAFAPPRFEDAARTEFLATVYVLDQDLANQVALVREEETRSDLLVHGTTLLDEVAATGKTSLRLARVDGMWQEAGWNVSHAHGHVPPARSPHEFRVPRHSPARQVRLAEKVLGRNSRLRDSVRVASIIPVLPAAETRER